MDKADKCGQMEHIMKDIGIMVSLMVRVKNMMLLMERYIMVRGCKDKDRVLASSFGVMGVVIWVHGLWIYRMGKEHLKALMERYILGIGS